MRRAVESKLSKKLPDSPPQPKKRRREPRGSQGISVSALQKKVKKLQREIKECKQECDRKVCNAQTKEANATAKYAQARMRHRQQAARSAAALNSAKQEAKLAKATAKAATNEVKVVEKRAQRQVTAAQKQIRQQTASLHRQMQDKKTISDKREMILHKRARRWQQKAEDLESNLKLARETIKRTEKPLVKLAGLFNLDQDKASSWLRQGRFRLTARAKEPQLDRCARVLAKIVWRLLEEACPVDVAGHFERVCQHLTRLVHSESSPQSPAQETTNLDKDTIVNRLLETLAHAQQGSSYNSKREVVHLLGLVFAKDLGLDDEASSSHVDA